MVHTFNTPFKSAKSANSAKSAETGHQTRRRQSGFSLIEVLVTMLILAFGLLGVAGLLVGGVSNAAASESFSKASQLAADMADRIRANPGVALSATSEYLTTYSDSVPTSPTTIALRDKKAWMEALAAQLPSGKGQITNTVSGGARQVNIEVRWSKCFGTLSDADRTTGANNCTDNPDAAFRTFNYELRL
jgi:type IV pilus assembly protein PilV